MGTNTASAPRAEPALQWPGAAGSVPAWLLPPSQEAGLRLWRLFMATRLLLAAAVLVWLAWSWSQQLVPWWLLLPGAAWFGLTLATLRRKPPPPDAAPWSLPWLPTLWSDLFFFALLQWLHHGGVNFMPLFVLPVLLAAVLGPLRLALGSAAFATLALLLDAAASHWLQTANGDSFAQAAVSGTGLFLVALLVHQLARRLGQEQARASGQHALAAAQAQVNQMIAGGMSEGVLVLDAEGRIWHANAAACTMLGAAADQPPWPLLPTLPAWPLLSDWVQGVRQRQQACCAALSLPTPGPQPLQVQARAQLNPAPPGYPTLGVCIVFLESQRRLEALLQTEKLAAMGRVSAAVAHEIRNPLAAISQASALLAEEALPATQQRLLTIIRDNSKRLTRTVDDVLELVRQPDRPDAAAASPWLDLDAGVARTLAEWQGLHAQTELHWHAGADGVRVAFEPEHLRRVLVNLLDNARRHGAATALRVETACSHGGCALKVWNAGAPMPAEVEAHLFEPFNSAHSRSSGLGLYLARQLCQRHGAQLGYRQEARAGVAGHLFTLDWPQQRCTGPWPAAA